MDHIRYEHRDLDVACELGNLDAASRVEEWQTRREAALETTALSGGLRLWLPTEMLEVAASLARREAECCGFLDIDLAYEGHRLRLDISSVAPGAASVIASLVGSGGS